MKIKGLECIIDKDRYIYDRDMPHLSYDIDQVKQGDLVHALVVDYIGSKLLLTTQNSKILGCK
jgi:exosome complex RNA-binding protein Csl4